MESINFISKGDYGNTIIMDTTTNSDMYEFYKNNDNSVYDRLQDLHKNFYKDIQSINSKISQKLSEYEDFLDIGNPVYIVARHGYYEGFEAHIESNTQIYRCHYRSHYKTDEDYKKAIINEHVENAYKYWLENDVYNHKDIKKFLNEYRKDLNTAFNEFDYELVKLGKIYGMAILDENGWVTKKHLITDEDVQIAKAKLDNQKTKEKSKDIDDDWER